MSAATVNPQLFEFEVNGHSYSVCFRDGMHAHIQHGRDLVPFVPYLKRYVPEPLHVQFLKAVAYVKKEFVL